MTIQIELTPELTKQAEFFAAKSHETLSEMAKRLIAEYVEDCSDVEKFFAERGENTDVLYEIPDVEA